MTEPKHSAGENNVNDTKREQLKPCPFCGKNDIDSRFACDGIGQIQAGCMDCGCCGPDKNTDSPDVSIAAWNSAYCWKQLDQHKETINEMTELLKNYWSLLERFYDTDKQQLPRWDKGMQEEQIKIEKLIAKVGKLEKEND